MADTNDDFDDILDAITNGKSGRVLEPNPQNLEWVIRTDPHIIERVKGDHQYAADLYRALCNNKFIREENSFDMLVDDKWWSCSWRYAGGIVADVLEKGDYMDWYCSGNEGEVRPEIAADLKRLGWTWVDK